MKKIVAFCVQNQLLVYLGMILVIIGGVISTDRMNTSFFPAQKEKNIRIAAIYPGASPSEVEEGITIKIELFWNYSCIHKITASIRCFNGDWAMGFVKHKCSPDARVWLSVHQT